jgi:hypothetical protein
MKIAFHEGVFFPLDVSTTAGCPQIRSQALESNSQRRSMASVRKCYGCPVEIERLRLAERTISLSQRAARATFRARFLGLRYFDVSEQRGRASNGSS